MWMPVTCVVCLSPPLLAMAMTRRTKRIGPNKLEIAIHSLRVLENIITNISN